MSIAGRRPLARAEELLAVEQRRVGTAVVITPAGDIDSYTAQLVNDALLGALDTPGPGPVVVDMTEVTFLSSRGLGVLMTAHEVAGRRGRPLRLVVGHTRPVLRPLHLIGLDQVLIMFESLADALADPSSGTGT